MRYALTRVPSSPQVPKPYQIWPNNTNKQLAEEMPLDMKSLSQCVNINKKRLREYGFRMLEVRLGGGGS